MNEAQIHVTETLLGFKFHTHFRDRYLQLRMEAVAHQLFRYTPHCRRKTKSKPTVHRNKRRPIPAITQLCSSPTDLVPHEQICLEMGTWLPSYGPGVPSVLVLRDKAWKCDKAQPPSCPCALRSSFSWAQLAAPEEMKSTSCSSNAFLVSLQLPFPSTFQRTTIQRRRGRKESMERFNSHSIRGTMPSTPSPGWMEINHTTLSFLMKLF